MENNSENTENLPVATDSSIKDDANQKGQKVNEGASALAEESKQITEMKVDTSVENKVATTSDQLAELKNLRIFSQSKEVPSKLQVEDLLIPFAYLKDEE